MSRGRRMWWRIATEEPIRIRPLFAWFDVWVGVYVDRKSPAVYVFPFPMIGLRIDWPGVAPPLDEGGS